MKKHNKTPSLQDLTLHQQRIRNIVQHINQYSPSFHINRSYCHAQMIDNIKQQREQYEDKIFEQNMKIIQRLQSVQSKINLKQFPSVNLAARSKRKHRSLSENNNSQNNNRKSKKKKPYLIKDEISLFQQNVQMIQKIQTVQKKIKCWQEKSLIKSRMIFQKRQQEKRKKILSKFNQISRQFNQIRIKKSLKNQNQKFQSPYIKQKMKQKQQMKKTSHTVNQLQSHVNNRLMMKN